MTHIILGQTQRSRWELLLHGSLVDRFRREVPDVAVQVIT
jgi:K+-sensing histidine kinase KdpD